MKQIKHYLPYGVAGAGVFLTSQAGAQAFKATDLDSAQGIVTAFLAVGATIVLGFVLYGLGKRAANRAK